MKKIIVYLKSMEVSQIYTLPGEKTPASFAEENNLSTDEWFEIDEDFPIHDKWHMCYSLIPNSENSPDIYFDLEKAKKVCLEVIGTLFTKSSNKISLNVSQYQLMIELSLPESERNVEYQKIIEDLTAIKLKYFESKELITSATSIEQIDNIYEDIKLSWNVDIFN